MKKFKNILSIMLVLTLAVLVNVTQVAYATEIEEVKYESADEVQEEDITKHFENVSKNQKKSMLEIAQEGTEQLVEGYTTYQVTLGENTYTMNSTYLNKLKNVVYNAYQSEQVRKDIASLTTDGLTLKADLTKAGETVSGFNDFLGWVIGLAAYLAIMSMGLFTACDILYMTVPLFRSKVTEKAQTGNGPLAARTDSKTGESKPPLVTDDAIYAVSVCTIENGKTPFLVYLKRRMVAWVLCAIVIYMLLTGNMAMIVDIALNLVEGFLRVIESLGA